MKVDAYKWNVAVRGLVESNQPKKAILGYTNIRRRGIQIDSHTLTLLLRTCTLLHKIHGFPIARQIHAHTFKHGFHSNTIVQTSLIRTYSLFGNLEDAHRLFDETPQRDTVLWNTLIAAYSQWKQPTNTIFAFRDMISEENVRPTESTVSTILSACSQLRALAQGKSVHGYALKNLVGFDTFVCNALIDMYSKCGCLSTAHMIFKLMRGKNVVSWTAMINGYADNDCPYEALALFKGMESAEVTPDEATVLGVISVCARLRSPELREWINEYVDRSGFRKTTRIGNALIDMYSKCGDLEKASGIFDHMAERSVVSWSSMIQGLAMHGHGIPALLRFVQMQREELQPDGIIFVSIIDACSHTGLVVEGRECFRSMVEDYGLVPSMEHYGGMVDLFCRAGLVDEALDFVARMHVRPDAAIWRAIVGACRDNGNMKMARRATQLLVDLEPEHSGNHVLKSNLRAMMGEWEDAWELRKKMEQSGLSKKDPGLSFVELDSNVNYD